MFLASISTPSNSTSKFLFFKVSLRTTILCFSLEGTRKTSITEMVGGKINGIGLLVLFFLCLSSISFPCCFSAANQPQFKKNPGKSNRFASSVFFPVRGNVYPLGYYSVSLSIGHTAKVFDLDIDSGSDLTWVQCDAPCNGCTMPHDRLYKPDQNLLACVDPICLAIETPTNQRCETPSDPCEFKVEYADDGSTLGMLVTDDFALRFTNGSLLGSRLIFGCGYEYNHGHGDPYAVSTAGVLGLGSGKASIVSQLSNLGITQNVVGHCLGAQGGYIFFGDDVVPSAEIAWIPMTRNALEKHYSSGPAELHFEGKSTGIKGLNIIFDSGSSYTYFNSEAYGALVNWVKKKLNGKPLKDAPEDQSLPICWKGTKAIKSLRDVENYFNPLALNFVNAKNSQLHISPGAYLIVTEKGNTCLGILNGTEVGLGKLNIIGDISLQDKMVIYDNQKLRIGWVPANCKKLPNVDGEYKDGFCQPYATNFGFCPATYSYKEQESCSNAKDQ